MRSWRDGVLHTWEVPFSSAAASATVAVGNMTFQQLLHTGQCPDAAECVLTFRALDEAGHELSRNFLLLAPFYDVTTMRHPKLRVTSVVERKDYMADMAGETAFDVT